MGIVIGETAEIGDDCLIYHGVTLGGTGKDHGKRHPTIGNNVLISCGAKVLGPFKVGDNARIAANAVVLSEVPEQATAVGIPAQVVRIAGRSTHFADEVDQINVQDPVEEKLDAALSRLEFLENSWMNSISRASGRRPPAKKRKKEKSLMYLYNSATHKKEEFKTHTPGHVEMYTCGPTVHHFAHIGNLRSYIMEDVLEKYLPLCRV